MKSLGDPCRDDISFELPEPTPQRQAQFGWLLKEAIFKPLIGANSRVASHTPMDEIENHLVLKPADWQCLLAASAPILRYFLDRLMGHNFYSSCSRLSCSRDIRTLSTTSRATRAPAAVEGVSRGTLCAHRIIHEAVRATA